MENLKVTLVQANQFWEDKEANFSNYEKLLSDIEETDLIVLPEMFQTGFTMNTSVAEKMDSSRSIEWLKRISQEKDCAFYTSLIIEENGNYFNRGVFVTPTDIFTYDKRKTFGLAGEDKVICKGKSPTIVECKGWKIQLQICYDLRFPEISRNHLINGKPKYDLLIYVANWPEKRIEHWNALLKARAIENQCYVVGVNRTGEDANNINYSGQSQLVLFDGQTKIISDKELINLFPINKTQLNDFRSRYTFLEDY